MRWSRGRLESLGHCPACGSTSRARSYARRDDALDMPDIWHVHECAGCASLYLDPRPDSASIGEAYRHYYTHSAEVESVPAEGGGRLLWSLIHGYLNRRFGMHRTPTHPFGAALFFMLRPWRLKLDYYGRHLPRLRHKQASRLFDVGAGNGGFLVRAREMGWQVSGCEPDARAVQACREQDLDVLLGDAFDHSLNGRQFDVITMSHVLEHVTHGPRLLERVHGLLAPGGCLWLAIPNTAALGLKVFADSWVHLHHPYHLVVPSASVLQRWLSDAGFRSISFAPRGAHARSSWRRSTGVARIHGMRLPSKLRLVSSMLASDFVASLGWCCAEELVVMARKADVTDV